MLEAILFLNLLFFLAIAAGAVYLGFKLRRVVGNATSSVWRLDRIFYALENLARVQQERIVVDLGTETQKSLRQLQRAAVDMQGAIALGARWFVNQYPELAEDMEPPAHWRAARKVFHGKSDLRA